jgi:hypothetical protein
MIPAARTLVEVVMPALVEIEDDDVLKGTAPTLTPDSMWFVIVVLCRKLTLPVEDTVEEACASRLDVDDEVVIVIKVLAVTGIDEEPGVTGVDEEPLDGGSGENGMTPMEETLDCLGRLLVVFW